MTASPHHYLTDGTVSCLYFSLGLVALARLVCVHGLRPINKKRVFHVMLVLFTGARTADLWTGMYDTTEYTTQVVLDRVSFSLFFSLLSFLVVQWADVLNPKNSSSSRRLWCLYAVMNLLFYGVVVASAILSVSLHRHTSLIDLPVTIVACATLVVSGAFVVFGMRLRRRARSLEGSARRRLNSVLQALSLVLALCTVLFLLQCIFFVSRIIHFPGDEDQQQATTPEEEVEEDKCGAVHISYLWCNALGVWLPELVPTACMLLLMWNREGTRMNLSAIRKLGGNFFSRTHLQTPLLRPDAPLRGMEPVGITTKDSGYGTPDDRKRYTPPVGTGGGGGSGGAGAGGGAGGSAGSSKGARRMIGMLRRRRQSVRKQRSYSVDIGDLDEDVLQTILSCQVFALALPETHRACFLSVEACPVPSSSEVAEMARRSVERRRALARQRGRYMQASTGSRIAEVLDPSTAVSAAADSFLDADAPLRRSVSASRVTATGATAGTAASGGSAGGGARGASVVEFGSFEMESSPQSHSSHKSHRSGARGAFGADSNATTGPASGSGSSSGAGKPSSARRGANGSAVSTSTGGAGVASRQAAPSPHRRAGHADYGTSGSRTSSTGERVRAAHHSSSSGKLHTSTPSVDVPGQRTSSGPLPRRRLVVDVSAANDSTRATQHDVVAALSAAFKPVGRTEVVTVSGRSDEFSQPVDGDMTVDHDGGSVNAAFSLLPRVECTIDTQRARIWNQFVRQKDGGLRAPSAISLSSFPSTAGASADAPASAKAAAVAKAAVAATEAGSGVEHGDVGASKGTSLGALGEPIRRTSSGGRLSELGTASSVQHRVHTRAAARSFSKGKSGRLMPPSPVRQDSYGAGWDSATVTRPTSASVGGRPSPRGSDKGDGSDAASGPSMSPRASGTAPDGDVHVSDDGSYVFVGGVCANNMILRFNCYAAADAVEADSLDASKQLKQPKSHPVFQETLLSALFPDDVGHDSGITFHDHFAGSPLHGGTSRSPGLAGTPPLAGGLGGLHSNSAAGGLHHSTSGGLPLGASGGLHHSHSFAAGQAMRAASFDGGDVYGTPFGQGTTARSTSTTAMHSRQHRPLHKHSQTADSRDDALARAAARRRNANKWRERQVWVGQAVCVISSLMASDSAQVELPLLREDGGLVGWLRVRLAALKKGKPESTRRRLSKWYGFRDRRGGRLLVEEDLRESAYAFSVPAKLLSIIVEERRANVRVAQRDLEEYRAVVAGVSQERHERQVNGRHRSKSSYKAVAQAGDESAQRLLSECETKRNTGPDSGTCGTSKHRPYSDAATASNASSADPDVESGGVGSGGGGAVLAGGSARGGELQLADRSSRRGSGSSHDSGGVMATVGMFGALVGYLREAEESKRAMRWLERRVEALSEYVEVLERCVGVGEGGRGYKGATFKASTQKKDQELRFVATNLHLQELRVRELAGTPQLGVTVDTGGTGQMSFATGLLLGRHNRSIASETIYSTTTVGAFAAHVYGFKGGGIRQLREYVAAESHDAWAWSEALGHGTGMDVYSSGSHATARRDAAIARARAGHTSSSFLSANARRRAIEDTVLHIQMREDAVICQAASALITAFARQLRLIQQYMEPADAARLLRQYSACGYLVCVESLLSTMGKEWGMLGDFDAGVKMLSRFAFRLLPPRQRPSSLRHHAHRASHVRGGGQVRISRVGALYVVDLRLWPVPEPRRSGQRRRGSVARTWVNKRPAASPVGSDFSAPSPLRSRSVSAPQPPAPVLGKHSIRGVLVPQPGPTPAPGADAGETGDGVQPLRGHNVVDTNGYGSRLAGSEAAGAGVGAGAVVGGDVDAESSSSSDALERSESSDTEASSDEEDGGAGAGAGAAAGVGVSDGEGHSAVSVEDEAVPSASHRLAGVAATFPESPLPNNDLAATDGSGSDTASRGAASPTPARFVASPQRSDSSGAQQRRRTVAAVSRAVASRLLDSDKGSTRSLDSAASTPVPTGPSSWPAALREVLPDSVMSGALIRVVPTLVTQGINEMQTLSNMNIMGHSVDVQSEINKETFCILREYVTRYREFEESEGRSASGGRGPTPPPPTRPPQHAQHAAAASAARGARPLSVILEDNASAALASSLRGSAAPGQGTAAPQRARGTAGDAKPGASVAARPPMPRGTSAQVGLPPRPSAGIEEHKSAAMLSHLPSRRGRGVVTWASIQRVEWLLDEIAQITVTTASGRTKNTTLLRRSAQLVRCLHGARMTACKSAKDRTAMSVTLEQARLLREHHALRDSDVERVTDLMRRHGVRRLNAEKNIGQARYAFNTLQQAMLPAEYRPPPGTGGGSHT